MIVREGRYGLVAAGGVVALVAVAMRVALITSTRPVGYDDGVYAASVVAMRDGGVPFRDVFSSQGPVFLPTLRFFDVIGMEQPWAPRIAMVVAGVVIGLGVFMLVSPVRGRAAGVAFGVAATSSQAVILASGPLESDGIALALVTVALVVAVRSDAPVRTAVAVGVLGGLALATKSLLSLPAIIGIGVALARRHAARSVGIASIAAVATGLGVTLLFDAQLVWDQYVNFHLNVPGNVSPLESAWELGQGLAWRDPLLVGLVALATAWWVSGRVAARDTSTDDETALRAGAAIWLAGSASIILLARSLTPGNARYVAFLVLPALLLLTVSRMPTRPLVIAVVALLPVQLAVNAAGLDGNELEPDEHLALAALEEIPDGSYVISDLPSLTYAAGLRSPPWLTDTSYARVRAAYLTAADIQGSLEDHETCALLTWSGRFYELDANLADTARELGYTVTTDFGPGKLLLKRPGCAG